MPTRGYDTNMKPLTLPSPDAILPPCRVVPVVVIHTLSEVIPLMNALCDGGVPCAEITFRTDCAAEAVRIAAQTFPAMSIGAGTVINVAQAKQAIESGAAFLVSPGLSVEVAEVCADAGIPYLPGCVTPTEIMQALSLGITVVKFFPAHVYGGLTAIKALSAPFPQVRFLPTGGIDLSNIQEYLACDKVIAVGGSFLTGGSPENVRRNCDLLHSLL